MKVDLMTTRRHYQQVRIGAVLVRAFRKLAFVYAAALFLLLAYAPGAEALEPGDAARDFALYDSSGAIVTLSDIQQGATLTVLEMVNIYCDSCRSMTADMNALADSYRNRGVRFVAVALANTPEEVGTLSTSWNITYPVLADPDKTTMHLYSAARVPHFFIIDSGGIIRVSGRFSRVKKLQKKIDSLLESTPARPVAGDEAPTFKLDDQFGDTVAVTFAQRNQNTILGFFAADDEANRAYARVLARQYDLFRSSGLRVFAVLPGSFSGNIRNFVSENEIAYPVLIDRNRDVFKLYGVEALPEIVIINERGRIMLREHERSSGELQTLFATAAPRSQVFESTQGRATFLKSMLPDVHMFKPFSTGRETLYLGMDSEGRMLLARFVFKDIMCGVCTDVHYAYTIDAKGMIRHIALVLPFELSGTPMDASPFINQFIGRRFDEEFVPGTNVDIISGATMSSKAFIEGVQETAQIVQPLVQDESFSKKFKAEACFVEQAEIELVVNNLRVKGRSVEEINFADLVPLLPGGRLPVCPEGGAYFITEFQAIPRVGCSLHGLDPLATIIH
jgi:peroxiredoxin